MIVHTTGIINKDMYQEEKNIRCHQCFKICVYFKKLPYGLL